jgi:hypothetical protein
MQKISKLNPLAVLAASIAFYFVGFVFYGLLFSEIWTAEVGLKEAQIAGSNQAFSMGLGFVNALITCLFLAIVLRAIPGQGLLNRVGWAICLWAGFAVTTLAYGPVYTLSSPLVFAIDFAHLLIAYCVAAIVLNLMKAT